MEAGQNYSDLNPAISICLLNRELFRDSTQAHHRFRLVDRESDRELPRAVEVHTIELTKYNLNETSIQQASKIEQWAFFLLYADDHEPERLRELFPSVEFQQAISVIEAIAAKSEDRVMYDHREKAQRDYQWAIQGAREEGREEGLERGAVVGRIQLLQQLLGEAESSLADLCGVSFDELNGKLSELQQRLRSRGN